MFGWAIAFLVIALVAAALGFGGVAGTAIAAAQLIFVVAIVAFLASAVLGLGWTTALIRRPRDRSNSTRVPARGYNNAGDYFRSDETSGSADGEQGSTRAK